MGKYRDGKDAGEAGGGGSYPLVAVCIDKDKNSQNALKYATETLGHKGQTIVLVHVNTKGTSGEWGGGRRRVQAADGPADEEPLPPVPLLLHAQRHPLQGRGAGRPRRGQVDRPVRRARRHREARRRRHRPERLRQVQGGNLQQHLKGRAGLLHRVRRLQGRQGDVDAAGRPAGAGRVAAPDHDPGAQAGAGARAEMDASSSVFRDTNVSRKPHHDAASDPTRPHHVSHPSQSAMPTRRSNYN